MSKAKVVGVSLVIGLVIGAVAGYVAVPKVQLGATPGPDVYEITNFISGFFDGGSVVATSTDDTTATFLNTDLVQTGAVTKLINFTPNVGSITATLPATSTLTNFVPKSGDSRTVYICNATSTAATPFTLAVGTGMVLSNATTTTNVGTGDCAVLDFVRNSDTDIEVLLDIGT